MNQEDIKGMRGVKYIQVFPSGRRVQAYIAEVDTTVGLTAKCYKDSPSSDPEYRDFMAGDDLTCINLTVRSHFLKDIFEMLEEIVSTGEFHIPPSHHKNSGGIAECGF